MFIYSFRMKGIKIASWIILLIFLIVGGIWFFDTPTDTAPKNVDYREEIMAWQV
ncbi:MAG: hypothetical protein IKJ06_00220 [Clostridia bacterium]|nr:hypothetical protein [Clostridia bacterium]